MATRGGVQKKWKMNFAAINATVIRTETSEKNCGQINKVKADYIVLVCRMQGFCGKCITRSHLIPKAMHTSDVMRPH